MVTIVNEDLRTVYHYLLTVKNIIDRDFPRIENEKSYLNNLVPSELVNIYTQKQNTALKFKDGVTNLLYDTSVVSLVTSFEKLVFAKYRTTYGSLKNVVSEHSVQPLDFFDSRENFIDDRIDTLSGIYHLIDGIIDDKTMEKLKVIKDFRNYIVHGKRDSKPPSVNFGIDEIAKTLDNAIEEISKR